MKLKKAFSLATVFLMTVCMLCAASFEAVYEGLREPDNKKRRDDEYVGVIIKTNVEEAEVYINGKLFGTTPVATVDLAAKYYDLEVRKSGYDTIKCRIHPKQYYTYTYIFNMEKTCGYIRVNNVPYGASVYIDGIRESSFPKEVYPGSYTVKVRKFGFQDFVKNIYVDNHKTVNVDVKLVTAPFEIKNFKVSRSVINPDYTSGIGKTNVSFYVTNDGTAMVYVADRYGNTVWSYNYNNFSTWEQSVTWEGRNSDGRIVPDGQYTIHLISYEYHFSESVKVDTSLVYPLIGVTPSGSGIGNLPCAINSNVNYVKLFASSGVSLATAQKDTSGTAIPLSAGLVIDFAKYFELAGFGGVDIIPGKTSQALGKGGVSFKGGAGVKLSKDWTLNLAGSVRYNYLSSAVPAGYDNGNGLAFGALAGLESSDVYLGLNGEYVVGATMAGTKGVLASDILKYGGVLSFVPARGLRTSLWGAMHNNDFAEAGAQIISMPGTGAFCFDVKAWVLANLKQFAQNKNMLINAQIGLSYLF